MYVHPMLKNHVNGCHGNHAFFHRAKEFIFDDKNSLHFWGVPMNDLAPLKDCPGRECARLVKLAPGVPEDKCP